MECVHTDRVKHTMPKRPTVRKGVYGRLSFTACRKMDQHQLWGKIPSTNPNLTTELNTLSSPHLTKSVCGDTVFKNTHISTLCNWKTWKTTQESIKTKTDKCIILFPCEAATPLPLSFFRTMRVNKLATREPRLNLPNVASNKKGQTPTLRSEKLLLRETVAVSGGDRSLRSFHWPVSWHECWLQGWSHSSRLLSCLLMFQWHLRCSDYILHLDKNLNRRGWWKEWGEKGIEEEGCCLTWHYQVLSSTL